MLEHVRTRGTNENSALETFQWAISSGFYKVRIFELQYSLNCMHCLGQKNGIACILETPLTK